MSYVAMVDGWVKRKKAKDQKKIDPEVSKTLVDSYEAFLRVGRVSSQEWQMLDNDEKACLLMAQKRIDIEFALMLAAAFKSDGPEELMAQVDGGAAKVRKVVDVAVRRYVERQNQKK